MTNRNPAIKVQFRCETGKIFTCDTSIFTKSPIIKSMFEDFGIGKGLPPGVTVDPIVIPLPNLTEECLWAIITWCDYHKDDPEKTEKELHDAMFHGTGDVSDWDKDFLASLEEEDALFDLLVASKYLGIPEMMDMLTTFIANAVVNSPPEDEERAENSKKDQMEGRAPTSVAEENVKHTIHNESDLQTSDPPLKEREATE